MWRLLWLLVASFWETVGARSRRGPLRPGWSFRFEHIVRFLRRDWVEMAWWWPPERMRGDLERRPLPRTHSKKCTRKKETLGGVPGEWFEPADPRPGAALIYIHGGSFLAGSSRTHAEAIARFALATRLRTFAPNYRLAPEHPYPAGAIDALAVYRAIVASGVDPGRVGVAGESAGGNLVVKLLLDLRDANEKAPAAAVAISGWFDLTASQPSIQKHEPFDYGTQAMLVAQGKMAAGELQPGDPSISLMNADLSRIGPLLVQAGTAEMLWDENRLLVERARDAGADAELDALPEMPHAATLLADFSPEGAAAVERASSFIVKRLTAE